MRNLAVSDVAISVPLDVCGLILIVKCELEPDAKWAACDLAHQLDVFEVIFVD